MEFYLSFEQILGRAGQYAPAVIALGLFALAVLIEGFFLARRDGTYPWKNASVSVVMTIGHIIAQAATHGIVFGVFAAFVYEYRLTTIPVSLDNWPSLVLLFVLVDLGFYVEHRCSHRINFLWASHSVHHSSEKMLATTAFRLAWTPILSGLFLFYLPIVWLGYDPVWVYGMVSADLAYQFFVHTELVPHVRWVEWFINTPSAHRVHHASNPEYIDKNYSGTLMLWDHLFGTYQPERPDVAIRYGLVHNRSKPNNPLYIAYEGLWDVLKSAVHASNPKAAVARLFGPP